MADKANVSGQLVVLNAYKKTFSTGRNGWFGKVLDPATGKRYQVVGAAEITEK